MSERAEQASARAAAAALRGRELRERIARLRAGESSTHEDVVHAQLSAAHQREEAVRAQGRLVRAYAAAAGVRWAPRPQSLSPSNTAAAPPDTARTSGADRENQILRRALVSIASSSESGGGWSKDRRQHLWRTLTDQCGRESWQSWSRALCRTVPDVVPELRGAAVCGYDDQGAPHLLAVTDEWTRRAEEIGQLVGEGPGFDAHRTQKLVAVRRLEDEHARWPGYVSTAVETGLRTVYALPVQLEGVGLGSLTLYPRDQGGPGWSGWPAGLFLAGVAAKALLADLDAVEEGWELGDFGDDRISIATGMLAVRLDVGIDEASARLRAFAFSNARGLGEVAQAVLDGTLWFA